MDTNTLLIILVVYSYAAGSGSMAGDVGSETTPRPL